MKCKRIIPVITLAALMAGCGGGGRPVAPQMSAADQEAVYVASQQLTLKSLACVTGQPETGASIYGAVSTLIEVFRKNPAAMDPEQHESMRAVLGKAMGNVRDCDLREAQRLRDALAAG
jgi:hypothetical protein